jgi:hypothetical protein
MQLKRIQEKNQKPAPPNEHGAVYWKDTELGKYIINDLAMHFTKGKDVPTDGRRFTAVATDGMLYFNDNSTELKNVLHLIDRWILQTDLDELIHYE